MSFVVRSPGARQAAIVHFCAQECDGCIRIVLGIMRGFAEVVMGDVLRGHDS